jgi:hypothetical protein
MAQPFEITKAFLEFLNKQLEASAQQLVEVAYGNGCHDAREVCLAIVEDAGPELGPVLAARIRAALPEKKQRRGRPKRKKEESAP